MWQLRMVLKFLQINDEENKVKSNLYNTEQHKMWKLSNFWNNHSQMNTSKHLLTHFVNLLWKPECTDAWILNNIITSRLPSLREGNIFSRVYLPVHRWDPHVVGPVQTCSLGNLLANQRLAFDWKAFMFVFISSEKLASVKCFNYLWHNGRFDVVWTAWPRTLSFPLEFVLWHFFPNLINVYFALLTKVLAIHFPLTIYFR